MPGTLLGVWGGGWGHLRGWVRMVDPPPVLSTVSPPPGAKSISCIVRIGGALLRG